MEQQPQLNEHNKQEYPPMHTCEKLTHCKYLIYESINFEHRQIAIAIFTFKFYKYKSKAISMSIYHFLMVHQAKSL